MTFSIETSQGTYKVELNKQIVFGGAVEFHSTIKLGRKVVGRIGDFRQVWNGLCSYGWRLDWPFRMASNQVAHNRNRTTQSTIRGQMTHNIILNGKAYLFNVPSAHLASALKDIAKYYPNATITILDNQ
jgi:hypothetical protein